MSLNKESNEVEEENIKNEEYALENKKNEIIKSLAKNEDDINLLLKEDQNKLLDEELLNQLENELLNNNDNINGLPISPKDENEQKENDAIINEPFGDLTDIIKNKILSQAKKISKALNQNKNQNQKTVTINTKNYNSNINKNNNKKKKK